MIYDPTPVELLNNYTFYAGDYEEHYYVPEGNTVYFASNGPINFKRNSSLEIDGELIILNNAEVHFLNYSNLTVKNAVFDPNAELTFTLSSALNISGTVELEENFVLTMRNHSKLHIMNNGAFTFNNNSKVIFKDQTCFSGEIIKITPNSFYQLEDESKLFANNLEIASNADLIFMDDQECIVKDDLTILNNANVEFGNLSTGSLYLKEGSVLNFKDGPLSITIDTTFIVEGINESIVEINMPTNRTIQFKGNDTLKLQYCDWEGGSITISPRIEDVSKELLIENCNFSNWAYPLRITKNSATYLIAEFHNNSFNNFSGIAISVMEIDSLIVDQSVFNTVGEIAVYSYLCNVTTVSNCDFTTVNKGI